MHRRTLSHPEKDSDGNNFTSIDASSPLLSTQQLHHTSVRHQNRAARAHYNARIMPDTVFLVRHGQSRGNDDENLYASTPDNAMPLTALGWAQARHAGQQLKRQLEEEEARRSATTTTSNNDKHKSINRHNIHFIVSPYVRTVETFHGMASAWCDPSGIRPHCRPGRAVAGVVRPAPSFRPELARGSADSRAGFWQLPGTRQDSAG